MSGQVLVAAEGADRPPHTHVVMHLDDGTTNSGSSTREPSVRWSCSTPPTSRPRSPISPHSASTRSSTTSRSPDCVRSCGSRRRLLKPLLLDQHLIAGIGNIYADEILHEARLRPDRIATSCPWRPNGACTPPSTAFSREAIDAGGSTLRDAQYVDLFGDGGSYQDAHLVYGRAGERCRTCGVGWIRLTVSAQRSTHYCPRCQR